MKKAPSSKDVSHGSERGKPHSRTRLRDLDRTWLRARPSRSALACGRTGSLGGIDERAPPRTGPEKEAPVACTFEDCQKARAGQLTPHNHTRDASACSAAISTLSGCHGL